MPISAAWLAFFMLHAFHRPLEMSMLYLFASLKYEQVSAPGIYRKHIPPSSSQTVVVLNHPTISYTASDTPPHYLNDSTRQQLREQIKEPISWETGTQYPHPHSNLNDSQRFQSIPRPWPTKVKATESVVGFLTPLQPLAQAQKDALNRLDAAANHRNWDPSLAIKALPDLDVGFFDGHLQGNAIAAWATEKEILLEKECGSRKPDEKASTGLRQPLKPEENEGQQRCKVCLNSDRNFEAPDPRLRVWETVFRELVVCFQSVPDFDKQRYASMVWSLIDKRVIRTPKLSSPLIATSSSTNAAP